MGRVGFFPSPGELNSGNILAGQPTANKSPPRAGFVNKDRVLLLFQNGSSSPLCARSPGGFFSGTHYGNLAELPEVNLTILWHSPNPGLPGVLNSE